MMPPMAPLVLLLLLAQSPQRVSLVFGGDVIPHRAVKEVAALHAVTAGPGENNAGWDHVVGPLAPALQRADLAVVNLETPIVTVKKPEEGDLLFSAPPALLAALARAGVDVATFANNHCLDQHREGITSTRQFLREAGLLSVGADVDEASAWTPLVVERNGLRLGFLAITRWLNGFNNRRDPALPHVPALPYASEPIQGGRTEAAVLAQVATAAAGVDALVVLIHWGAEYRTAPAPEDRRLAQQLLEAGALAVIGHHPHVLQPVEAPERPDGTRGLVAFSLGNLVSNQDAGRPGSLTRDGLLLEVTVEREAPGAAVRLAAVRGVPVATEHRLGAGKRRSVQAVVLSEELAAIEQRLVELAARGDGPARTERKTLQARRQAVLERTARIQALLP